MKSADFKQNRDLSQKVNIDLRTTPVHRFTMKSFYHVVVIVKLRYVFFHIMTSNNRVMSDIEMFMCL